MAEQSEPRQPMEDIVRLWQAWMSAGLEAMQRTANLFAPPGGLPEWTAGLHDRVGKAVQATLEAACLLSAQDLQRLAEEVRTLGSVVEGVRAGLAALDSLGKGQQEVWQAMGRSVEQITQSQQEILGAMAAWRSQWEERMAGLTRALEDWHRQWDATLRQGMATSQASQKNLEEFTRTMWDLSQKMMEGKGSRD